MFLRGGTTDLGVLCRRMENVARLREQIDGLSDGDGHFEVAGSGAATRLRYQLDPPYDHAFEFIEPWSVIEERITVGYVRSAAEVGVAPLSLFAVHVWEAALTAKDGESLMKLRLGGVSTFRPGKRGGPDKGGT
ncbi:hypothetical protein LVY72_02300 [Arthrobacter sp. I2-34]|uniref:Uncharacterized protein n=1 Tax=Arthrobacter hankyongi TaxID=2904801 RepID=A0ABS9L270_9MICC|nr:hypothetical protein [Arthrobacter hankyongi]MCG2620739.1 hypothetical protein [Arthrobacter hankyongi]